MNRKLDVGRTISQAFSIYGSQAGVLLPVAFGLFLIVAVINAILAGSLILVPLALAVSVVAGTLYQGMVVGLVSDVQDGCRDSSVEDLMRSFGRSRQLVRGNGWQVFGVIVIVFIIVAPPSPTAPPPPPAAPDPTV